MAITKYTLRTPSLSTWRDLDTVSRRFARWAPAMSVEETKDEILISAELPGLGQDDISIELENHVLTISGEKAESRTEGDEERRYHLWERQYGSFQRGFTLPSSVAGDDIEARFENGVLLVTLPKAPEAKGRKIAIEAA